MYFQSKKKKLSLQKVMSANVPLSIFSDAKRYKQVIYNLIGNALKFTYTGSITI